ncbi:hypothetical protein D3C84_1280890 [compost metagenome]
MAWTQQDGSGELNLTVIDRTNTRVGQARLTSSTYCDPAQLADVLIQSREQLSRQGFDLEPWSMPE